MQLCPKLSINVHSSQAVCFKSAVRIQGRCYSRLRPGSSSKTRLKLVSCRLIKPALRASLILSAMLLWQTRTAAAADPAATRATLSNGMRVVIVEDFLAPLATVQMNILAGGNESPAGFPGMAHAQEHMAFRGCTGMTADQTAAIYAQLGDESNAETQQNVTEYYTTVPAADLEVALHAQANCLRGIDDAQTEWEKERGALEQELAEDLSNPSYTFLDYVNQDMFPGTPYAHDALGTKNSLDATTAPMLKEFYRNWYTPGNAILVVVGSVDPAKTLTMVKRLFSDIPDHPLPPRPVVNLKTVKPENLVFDSNLGYVPGFTAFRLPGTSSPDYAATQILVDVLGSQRADLYGMVAAGKALDAEFELAETYPEASVGIGTIDLPAGSDAASAIKKMRRSLKRYAEKGLPADLVEAAKQKEIVQAEFNFNSIPDLADTWSKAIAAEDRTSPEEDIEAIRKVTLADVNRVAHQYLLNPNVITATVTPVPSGQPVAAKDFGGIEKIAEAPARPVQLPRWAAVELEQLRLPEPSPVASDTILANGIRLIVRTDTTSPTITLLGSVKHNADLQTPAGEEGLSDVLDGLYSYGTQTLDRLAFQKALDDISANASAGYSFSLTVTSQHFSRGVQLLADNELYPVFRSRPFAVTRRQTRQFVDGNLQTVRYRASRTLDLALLPAGDPTLREITPATLSKLTLEDVKRFYSATMRPDLTTIVVVGDVTPEETRTVIDKWFGGWEAVGPTPSIALPPTPLNQPSTVNLVDPGQTQDSVILAGELALNRFDPDYYPLRLGMAILGDGFNATRLYRDLRQETGYVYAVDVSLDASDSRASYSISYSCNPQNAPRARALIERDLNQMRTGEVSESELRQTKALLSRRMSLNESSERAVAEGILYRAELGLPLDEPFRAAKRYMELNAQDVKAAFSKYIQPGHLVEVVEGPPVR
jgi:zinc protease